MVKGTKEIMEEKLISKNEFWLGIAIITFCVGFWNLVKPPVLHRTATFEIKNDIHVVEVINCSTDSEGNVKCD